MHIKFLGGGGSGAAAAAYLTAEKDAQGIEREAVTVLRGDPELVADVADSLDFAHTYTSGVLAWARDDEPTAAEIEAVLDEFEQTAWAGLEPDRYAWTAVQHDEPTGAVHVHILAARVDLETGKSLNIAPPGWQEHFDPLRDWQNAGARVEPAGRPGPAARRGAGPHGLPGRGRAAPGPGRGRGPAPGPDCVSDRGGSSGSDPGPGGNRPGFGGGRLNRAAPR